jgi:hypothetical protein
MIDEKETTGLRRTQTALLHLQHDGGWYARAEFWAALAGLLFVFPSFFAFVPSPFIPPDSAVKEEFPTLPYRRIIAFPRFPPIHTYVIQEKRRGQSPPIG